MDNTKKNVGEIKGLVQTFLRYTTYREGPSGIAGAKTKPKEKKLNHEKDSHDENLMKQQSDTDSA